MSNNDKSDLEDKNQVVVTPDDVKECAKFFEFFEIQPSAGLKAALDGFIANPTLQTQNELKYWLAYEVSYSEHPVFKDEVFAQIRPETKECQDALAFERELEGHLTGTKD